MVSRFLKFVSPFTDKKKKNAVAVVLLREKDFTAWLKKQKPHIRKLCSDSGFKAQPGKALLMRHAEGKLEAVIVGIQKSCGIYDCAAAVLAIRQNLTKEFIKSSTFYFDSKSLSRPELENACVGWGLGCYSFDAYKANGGELPLLAWPKGVNKSRVGALVKSVHLLRNLINAPANAMGPEEIEQAARGIAAGHKANIKTIADKALLDKNFPLIHAVGHGSDRRPRLIEINWGNPKNPRLTLVGKGVAFDTGGLNIKPTPAMALMKKDMGGAAHVLALANLVMALKIPVRLRVLISAVENSISGRAFRPGDIFKSRKGLTVENTNTDAEGRLILADALTYASEDKPDLIIDFATLTGSARAGLGPDIPPFFTNVESIAAAVEKASQETDDPVWPMPLWQPYKKYLESPVADLVNSSGVPGDLIYSALFLQQFVAPKQDWLHFDVYAWEHSGRPGRPRGGAETGLRAALAFIEKRYGR